MKTLADMSLPEMIGIFSGTEEQPPLICGQGGVFYFVGTALSFCPRCWVGSKEDSCWICGETQLVKYLGPSTPEFDYDLWHHELSYCGT